MLLWCYVAGFVAKHWLQKNIVLLEPTIIYPRTYPCQVPLQCFHQFHACLCYTCWPRPGCNSKSCSSATESPCFDLRFSRALCMCRGACVKVFRIGSWPGSLKISRLDYCAFREIHPPGRTKKRFISTVSSQLTANNCEVL